MNILDHEVSFGGENLPEEYLLARPRDLDVNSDGDILVVDESRIKIFDRDGVPKRFVGNKGQGPGEFEFPESLSLSNDGYLLLKEDFRNSNISLFSKNLEFIKRKYFREYLPSKSILEKDGMTRTYPPGRIMLIAKDEVLYMMGSEIDFNQNDEFTETLFYQKNDDVVKIRSYEKRSIIATEDPRGREFFPPLGELSFALLPEARMVYSHSAYDFEELNGKEYYILNISTHDGSNPETIKQMYQSIQLTDVDELTERYRDGIQRNARSAPYYKAVMAEINEKIEQGIKCAPHREILTDGEYIFVFTFNKNKTGATFTDVFNADEMKYVCSAYFDFIPDKIKNKYAYRLKDTKDEFPVVEKYKIIDAVYGK
ncbi:MAG: hypothetical protein GY863_20175 [bacterium]|nr:hypothetical protein [bacterium]